MSRSVAFHNLRKQAIRNNESIHNLREQAIRHLPDVHAYADDTQLYLSSKPDGATNELDVICALQNCMKDIRTWITVDNLKLNDGKTEFLIIGTAAQLKKVNISTRLKTHRLLQVDIDRREQCCATNYEQVVNHVVPRCYS